jgi:succinyl-diaminopimelate desuccinylase
LTAHASPLESLALELLGIPSVIGGEAALADHVEARARARAFEQVVRAGDNLLLLPRPLREGRPRLLLAGHLDTVPESAPNPPRIEGDRIFGLGSSDMKCADALILHLLERAVEEEPALDLCGVLYAREEGPFADSGFPEIAPAIEEHVGRPDLAIAMEPTDNHLELGCLGTMHAGVSFHGQRAHSARPWQGRNAIHMAAPLLAALAALPPRECTFEGLRFREVASATMVDYDGARNVVPGRCEVNVNFRFAPDRSGTEAIAWVTGFVREAVGAEAIESGAVTIEIRDLCPSGAVCHDNAVFRSLRAALPAGTEVRAKQAWTDVGRLSETGIDALNFGPGSGAQAHQAGEWCSRETLRAAQAALEGWLFA